MDQLSQSMRTIALFLFLACLQHCLGQTDTNVLATGDWSEIVLDNRSNCLRGRLLVYNDERQEATRQARVYLELQHLPSTRGSSLPLDVYFGIFDETNTLHFEMRDEHDRPIPRDLISIDGIMPAPYHVIIPCDSTIRLRADLYSIGLGSYRDGLGILAGGFWFIPPNATNEYFLSATFTAKDHPVPFENHDFWQGTLHLPKVKIPVPAKKP